MINPLGASLSSVCAFSTGRAVAQLPHRPTVYTVRPRCRSTALNPLCHGPETKGGYHIDKTFYNKYIKSPQWAAKRELWFNTYGKFCRACSTRYGPIQLHHMTYDRLGNERMGDLIALCSKCHREVETLYRRVGRGDRMSITLAFVKARRKQQWKKRTS